MEPSAKSPRAWRLIGAGDGAEVSKGGQWDERLERSPSEIKPCCTHLHRRLRQVGAAELSGRCVARTQASSEGQVECLVGAG